MKIQVSSDCGFVALIPFHEVGSPSELELAEDRLKANLARRGYLVIDLESCMTHSLGFMGWRVWGKLKKSLTE